MSTNRPDLSMAPSRRRRNAEVEDRVQADVQREELRQLNVAVPLGLHREMRLRAVQEDCQGRRQNIPLWRRESVPPG